MSLIPKIEKGAVISVKDGFDREGDVYITNMMDQIYKLQPLLTKEIGAFLYHIQDKMTEDGATEELTSYVCENVGYRMFAMLKSLYIQEEVNELEEQSMISEVPNGQN